MRKQIVSKEDFIEITLEGLKYFISICEKYDLTYFLAAGSLIGAVRHGGFIPWDDDIDIFLPRKDYEQFISLANVVDNNEWKIYSYKTVPGYCYPWAKLCNNKTKILPCRFHTGVVYGIGIDIFPLDSVSADNEESAFKKILPIRYYYKSIQKKMKALAIVRKGGLEKTKELIRRSYYHLFGKHFIDLNKSFDEIHKNLLSLNDSNAIYCINLGDTLNILELRKNERLLKWEYFTGEKTYMSFEGIKVRVPSNTDAVLRKMYNDYMTLPPEKDRVSNHTFTCFWA